eukprot:CAMPEP_0171273438 /NCGR_PEP_ID=MMETSP0790-20130122/62287_1 /TAXON_ID=2925 /ORGANISM="Alexandrium catenella, Strain OF101" /LENGTH=265 /DNA_ID=CAMNT_0011742431 /DNA_START=8 /DNA_END=803 /DNA_ORIENTATION=+
MPCMELAAVEHLGQASRLGQLCVHGIESRTLQHTQATPSGPQEIAAGPPASLMEHAWDTLQLAHSSSSQPLSISRRPRPGFTPVGGQSGEPQPPEPLELPSTDGQLRVPEPLQECDAWSECRIVKMQSQDLVVHSDAPPNHHGMGAGHVVVVRGLHRRTRFNGAQGRLVGYSTDTGRWSVVLSSGEAIRVHASNLEAATEVQRINGSKAMPMLLAERESREPHFQRLRRSSALEPATGASGQSPGSAARGLLGHAPATQVGVHSG